MMGSSPAAAPPNSASGAASADSTSSVLALYSCGVVRHRRIRIGWEGQVRGVYYCWGVGRSCWGLWGLQTRIRQLPAG
jgi:hypothetical protein